MIDQFDKQTFENYLESHSPYEPQGLIDGEYCYRLILDGQASIMLRSSIKANGLVAGSGQDSIRLWLAGNDNKPLGSKIDSYTKRTKGWQARLTAKIYELAKRRANAGDCHYCGKPFGIYKNKTTGELFVKCWPCSNHFNKKIVGNLANEGQFAPASQMDDFNEKPATKDNGLNEFLENPYGDDNPQPDQPKQVKSNIPTCPKCNAVMILKSGAHFDDFWGCRNFPRCRGTVNIPKPKIEIKVFKANKYQDKIYDFVDNGDGHGVIDGVAGCGKTTTNVQALQLVPKSAKVKYTAFNKHIERDISRKAPDYVDVSTFHKWGKANILSAYPNIEINKWKVHNIIDNLSPRIDGDYKADIVKVISLLKGNMLEPIKDEILLLVDSFDLDIPEGETDFIRQVFIKSIRDMKVMDFDDMVYWPASEMVKCAKFDYIFVDEAQDMNTAQYILSKNSLANDGRMLLIGDPNQSIYAFRGAHIGIMDFMANEMNATRLPLSISYRAPLAIVELVNKEYPHIKFEASKTAKNGFVGQIGYDDFIGNVDQNSGVLCRTNAPLVAPCFELIRSGIKANILGRDIGTGLVKLIEKREKLQRVTTLDDLLNQVRVYCNNEIIKATKKDKLSRVALLQDQQATIIALSDGCDTIQELKRKTASTFSDKVGGVTFSTVHKAKGLEWEKVFVIGPKGNHPMGDKQQETNIRYVRDTRTLDKLYYVEDTK